MEVYSNIQVDMLSSCCRTYSNIVPLQNAFWLPCVTPATAGPAELCEKKTYLLTALSISKGTYVYINYACFSCCQPLTAQCPRPRTLTSSSNICPFHLPAPSPFVFSLVVVGLACCRWLQACWLPLQQLLQQLL